MHNLMKVLLIGDKGVGKTTLLNQFAACSFADQDFGRSFGMQFKYQIMDGIGTIGEDDNQRIKLQIWDTVSEHPTTITTGAATARGMDEENDDGGVASAHYRNMHGIVIMYDVCSLQSFVNVRRKWLRDIERHGPKHVHLMLVGNKCDGLAEKGRHQHREVSYERGRRAAQEWNMSFVETSAMLGSNVDTVFRTLATQIHNDIVQHARI